MNITALERNLYAYFIELFWYADRNTYINYDKEYPQKSFNL